MIVLAALNKNTFWPPNRTFNARKNGQGELAGRLGGLFLILKTATNQKMPKQKIGVIGTLILLQIQ